MLNKHQPENLLDTLFNLPLYPEIQETENKNSSERMTLNDSITEKSIAFLVDEAEKTLANTSEKQWMLNGKQRAFQLFHAAAKYVPAYKDFLAQNNVDPSDISSVDDFENIPVIDKESYLRKYPVDQLVWHRRIQDAHMVVASSGSYGKPFMWPRSPLAEAESLLLHELSMARQFNLKDKNTLVIVCFAMGMHIAGTTTMQAVIQMSRKGYPITVVTPGYSTESVLDVFDGLADKFDQVILAGYPPFLKEIIDRGIAGGVSWSSFNLKLLMAGEGFNETWRDYVSELIDADPDRDFQNIYGSADAAAMGVETISSIAFRRALLSDSQAMEKLFNSNRLPYLYQFYPEQKYFESINGELVITAPVGIPLIRYNIHDQGGIVSRNMMREVLGQKAPVIADAEDWDLPYVYVYGRTNQMVVLYGANIYIENIKRALEDVKVRENFSGKVVMYTETNETQDDTFFLDIECAQGVAPSGELKKIVSDHIVEVLLQVNSEFRVIRQGIGEKVLPHITLHEYGSELFRSRKMKHKWVEK